MRSRSRVQGEEGECRLQGEEWTMKGSGCKCGVSQGSSNTMRMVMLWTEMRIRKWMIQQKFGKVPTLPIESGGEEEITDFN